MTTTWENAAADVGRQIRDTAIGGYPNPLEAVDGFIDGIKAGSIDARAGLMLIADEATTVYAVQMGLPRAVALDGVLTTIAEKQADYGPQNILWAGVPGILLRMHDKTARIRNLQAKGRVDASNEPLADSWLDLVGYSIVGIMLLDGTFEYPLARDLAPPVAVADATGDPLAALAEDEGIRDALRQFVAQASAPEYVHREADDVYSIEGGGSLTVYPAPDHSHTHVTLSDGKGGRLDIMAARDMVTLDTDGTVFDLNDQRMSVILCMLLGAAEAALDWRETNITAYVPREK